MDICLRKVLPAVLIIAAAALLAFSAYAADFDNQGFAKDVSSMKDRFGLCNEFLNVRWLDKSGTLGLLKADVYKNGDRVTRYLIVHLEKPGTKGYAARGNGIFYEISEKQYSSPEFEKFLRGARYTFSRYNVFMNVTKGKRSERFPQEPLPFEAFVAHKKEFPNRSFSDFSKTVCVAYPDGKSAFVIEARKPFMGPVDDKTKQAFDAVSAMAKQKCGECACNLESLKDTYSLDINRDGVEDYIFAFSDGKAAKGCSKRYMMVSGKGGYVPLDVSGCLGYGRFFYGYSDGKAFHLGRCSK